MFDIANPHYAPLVVKYRAYLKSQNDRLAEDYTDAVRLYQEDYEHWQERISDTMKRIRELEIERDTLRKSTTTPALTREQQDRRYTLDYWITQLYHSISESGITPPVPPTWHQATYHDFLDWCIREGVAISESEEEAST